MEKDECQDEDFLENERINAGLDENKHKYGPETNKQPVKPKVLEASLRSDAQRERSRLWRKKRIFNGSKLSSGKEKGKLPKDAFRPRNVPKSRKGALYTILLRMTS